MRLRVEPYTVGDFIHVFNRGNRRTAIVRDVNDKWRFLKILRFYNDKFIPEHPQRDLEKLSGLDPANPVNPLSQKGFKWPKNWPPHQPLVKILSYCLRENHFHLLLKEIIKGGLALFMKRLGNAFTGFVNLKYEEVGRVFQSPYRGKTIQEDVKNLQYVDAYIQVFNPFEDYPGGIEQALKEFDRAFKFAFENPFCSLGESFGKRNLEIIDRDILGEMFPNLEVYKKFTYDALIVRNIREILGKLTIE